MTLTALGASLIPAVGNLVGNLFGFGSQQSANKTNMELAQYQYEKNLEMWNRNNEYNTPLNQRKRMEEAGFNPNLVYGHGSVANTSTSMPTYQAPTISAYTGFSNFGQSLLDGYLSYQQNKADIDLKKSQAAKNYSDAGLSTSQTTGQDRENELKLFRIEYENRRKEIYDALVQAEKDNNETQVKILKQKLSNYEKEYESIEADIRLKDSHVDLNKARESLAKAETITERYKPDLMRSQEAVNWSQVDLNSATTQNVIERTINQQIENTFAVSFNLRKLSKLERELKSIVISTLNTASQLHLNEMQYNKLFYETLKTKFDAENYEALKGIDLGIKIFDAIVPF